MAMVISYSLTDLLTPLCQHLTLDHVIHEHSLVHSLGGTVSLKEEKFWVWAWAQLVVPHNIIQSNVNCGENGPR